jgi:hypothetical protein
LSIEVLVPVLAGNQNLRLHKKVKINFGRSMVNAVTRSRPIKAEKMTFVCLLFMGKYRTYRAFVPGS